MCICGVKCLMTGLQHYWCAYAWTGWLQCMAHNCWLLQPVVKFLCLAWWLEMCSLICYMLWWCVRSAMMLVSAGFVWCCSRIAMACCSRIAMACFCRFCVVCYDAWFCRFCVRFFVHDFLLLPWFGLVMYGALLCHLFGALLCHLC